MTRSYSLSLPDSYVVGDASAPVYPYTRPASEVLVDALNAETGLNLGYGDVVLGKPRLVVTSMQAMEMFGPLPAQSADLPTELLTMVEVTPTPLSGLSGRFEILYRRMALADAGTVTHGILVDNLAYVDIAQGATDPDLLNAINALLHVELTVDDVVIQRTTEGSDNHPVAFVSIHPDHLLWYGMFKVLLVPSYHLGLALVHRNLDGLVYPGSDATPPLFQLDLTYVSPV